MINKPLISVVIPVRNEIKKIQNCIEGILNQSVKVFEIIVIDSGSTDGTIELLKKYNSVQIISIPSDKFNHGTTRNIGIEVAKGEFILMTVGDAIATNNKWIENLLLGFINDTVACVYGQQIVPHEKDANPLEWFRPVTKNPQLQMYKSGGKMEFELLSPKEKNTYATIDNVTAMYRSDFLKKHPFQKITYGEDLTWGKWAQENGYTIIFNPNARVYHYHITDCKFNFKRTFAVLYLRFTLFGYVPKYKKDVLFFLRVIKHLLRNDKISLKEKIMWYFYNIKKYKSINKALKLFISLINQPEKLEYMYEKIIDKKPPVPVKQLTKDMQTNPLISVLSILLQFF